MYIEKIYIIIFYFYVCRKNLSYYTLRFSYNILSTRTIVSEPLCNFRKNKIEK